MTVRDALARARAELGPDALVLASRMVASRGWRGWMGTREVEVTIAAEREVSTSRPLAQGSRQPGPRARPSDGRAALAARLGATGLAPAIADEVVEALPAATRRTVTAEMLESALGERLGGLVAEPGADARIELFVGPPGGGKTTSIAKIAAQERALRGRRVALVGADAFRVGAIEQLRLYAEIIGTTFHVARSDDELERALERIRGRVLIDTAGRSRRDGGTSSLLDRLAGRRDVRTHLVVPADTPPQTVELHVQRHASVGPDCVLLTRLDETASIAPLLEVLERHRLPVSFMGTGQRVPEDLERATSARLAAFVLGETPIEPDASLLMEGTPA